MDKKLELVRAAEKKIKLRNFNGALGDLVECLEMYPNFTVAKVLKAECLYHLGKYGESLEILNEVLFSSPDNIKARKLAVECLIETGDIEEARSHIDFLTFLLPPGDSFFDIVEEKINSVSVSSGEEQSPDFEIERTEYQSESEQTAESQSVDGGEQVSFESETPLIKESSQPETDFKKEVKEEEKLEEPAKQTEFVSEEMAEQKEIAVDTPQEIEMQSENTEESELTDARDELMEKGEDIEPVSEQNLVTGVLPEQISTVTLPEKREEPEIKTRTLALIYERQGMFQESLEILEELFEETKDVSLLDDIERIKAKIKGDGKNSFVLIKIKKLENWLERIKWNSNN